MRNDAVQPIRTEVKRAFSALLFTLITDVDDLLILARDPEILRCANIGIQHPSGYEDVRMNKLIMKICILEQLQINGKILTKDNASLDAVTLLKQYLEGREICTFSELADKVVELTGGTNRQFAFQALYDCMVRIDSDNFVADRFVSFNVDEIDTILSGIITNHFCAIQDVTTFALFPVCGYPWNSFLLESYCYKFSKKYSLKESYGSTDSSQAESYVRNGGWNARTNGRSLKNNPFRCVETVNKQNVSITVIAPKTDWKEWIKTIGELSQNESSYTVRFEGVDISFNVLENAKGYVVTLPEKTALDNPKFTKLFKQVFRKAS